MKRVIGLFAFLFLFSFVNFVLAGDSSVDVNIENPGCDLRDDPLVGEFLVPGGCSQDGKWSCDLDTDFRDIVYYNTVDELKGCSYGKDEVNLTDFCCPNGYYCQDDGTIQCVPRLEDCGSFEDRNTCTENACYWFGETSTNGVCVNSIRELGCNNYQDENSCSDDFAGLAERGIGSNVCGSQVTIDGQLYIIPRDSCSCEWNNTGNSCELTYRLSPSIWQGTPDSFNCAKNYSVGQCSDAGKQTVSWIARVIPGSVTGDKYAGGIVPTDDLIEAGCVEGSEERVCGESLLKLPGFSFVSFLLSAILIGIIYFFREEIFKFKK